jgi:hypothetical protein
VSIDVDYRDGMHGLRDIGCHSPRPRSDVFPDGVQGARPFPPHPLPASGASSLHEAVCLAWVVGSVWARWARHPSVSVPHSAPRPKGKTVFPAPRKFTVFHPRVNLCALVERSAYVQDR